MLSNRILVLTPDLPAGDPLPTKFIRRLVSSVALIFLATMAIFLAALFFTERRSRNEMTFKHLEETLGILTALPRGSSAFSDEAISETESRLQKRTGVAHKVLFADRDLVVRASSDPALQNRDLKDIFELSPGGRAGLNRAFAAGLDDDWHVASVEAKGTGGEAGRVYLLRSRRADRHFATEFLGLHGIHVLLTLIVFATLLRFFGIRFVRRPIEQLAAHIDRVGAGEFSSSSQAVVDGTDEFAWLARRFSEMQSTLKKTIERLVRTEKYFSASGVAWRVAHEMNEPLESLNLHIQYLEDPKRVASDVLGLAVCLRSDRDRLVSVLSRLEEIQPPELSSNGKRVRAAGGRDR